MSSNLAIIPARGGSKRIPRKNIRPFMGKPVIGYSIQAALESGMYDTVMVSTDDEQIASIARSFGAEVPFMRSEETSGDFATTAQVIAEVLSEYEARGKHFDTVSCIYSTAPFLTGERIKEAFSLMDKCNYDSVFTVVQYSYPVQRSLKITDGKVFMTCPEYRNARSQDLEPVYHDAGQFYLADTVCFKRTGSLWGDNTGAIVLAELEVQDLDTEMDWILAEMKFNLLKNS